MTLEGKMIKGEIIMTTEEKAKAYDEAIGRAQKATRAGSDVAMDIIQYIFPELKESEDEKIRKELLEEIDFIIPHEDESDSEGRILPSYSARINKYRAYLEKQKEQKPNIEIYPENGYPIEDCDYGLEIAENILEKTLGKVEGYQSDDGIREHQTAIQAVKDAMKEQKPAKEVDNLHNYLYGDNEKSQEWSEEDEKIRQSIIKDIEWERNYTSTTTGKVIEKYNEQIKWLKSLRPQPKQEWSEEDEKIWRKSLPLNFKKKNEDAAKLCSNEWSEEDEETLKDIIRSVTGFDATTGIISQNFKQHEKKINFLKSLCPQSKQEWSEDDKKMLDNAIHACLDVYGTMSETADWLKTRLKSLRPQSEQEWGEEDERLLNLIIDILDRDEHNGIITHNELIMCVRLLKSLRPQPKQEWSEEDKQALQYSIDWLSTYRDRHVISQEAKDDIAFCIEKLKTLRPQPHWKPSEKQINMLRVIVEREKEKPLYGIDGYSPAAVLESLYNDLKKLMEE